MQSSGKQNNEHIFLTSFFEALSYIHLRFVLAIGLLASIQASDQRIYFLTFPTNTFVIGRLIPECQFKS